MYVNPNPNPMLAMRDAAHRAALRLIPMALGRTPQDVIGLCPTIDRSLLPNAILFHALEILKMPGKDGNPRFDRIPEHVELFVTARWMVMDPVARSEAGGSFEKYLDLQRCEIYEGNGMRAPGINGWVRRWGWIFGGG